MPWNRLPEATIEAERGERPLNGWPARLTSDEVTVRPLAFSDAAAWRDARRRNVAWLRPWDATVP
ncbi:MAG TPA: hypothetical protein VGD85_18000, partial [Nocardioides sp.]